MKDANAEGCGRRTFLKRMATMAGTTALAPALFGAATVPARPAALPAHGAEEASHATERLAAYAAALRYEDLPPGVVQRAKDCITDTVAAIVLRRRIAVEPDDHRLCAANGAAGREPIFSAPAARRCMPARRRSPMAP